MLNHLRIVTLSDVFGVDCVAQLPQCQCTPEVFFAALPVYGAYARRHGRTHDFRLGVVYGALASILYLVKFVARIPRILESESPRPPAHA